MKRKLPRWALAVLLLVSAALSAGGDGTVTISAGRQPSLGVDRDGGLHLAYEGLSQSNDIFCRNSSDLGQNWSTEANISGTPGVSRHPTQPIYFDTPGNSSEPCIAVDDKGHVAVAWADTSSNPNAPDIFLVQSADQGHTFTPPTNLSNTPGISQASDIAIAAGKVIVIWDEAEKGSTLLKSNSVNFPRRVRQPIGGGKY